MKGTQMVAFLIVLIAIAISQAILATTSIVALLTYLGLNSDKR
jgi:hypothetical protein